MSSENKLNADPKVLIQDLNFFYGTAQALWTINLAVPIQQVTALIGPSGCGKSTLLRCLNRLNDLVEGARLEGTILLDGLDIHDPGLDITDLRKRVGMVFQRSNPFPKSIYENVAYGPRLQGTRNRAELDVIAEKSLTEAARNVILCSAIGWDRKDRFRFSKFDEFTHEEEASIVRDSGGLLHVVGHDNNREGVFERKEELFNLACRDRVILYVMSTYPLAGFVLILFGLLTTPTPTPSSDNARPPT